MKQKDYEIRAKWIENYLKKSQDVAGEYYICHVDILDQCFSDMYIETFNPDYDAVNYGAYKCKELGQVLSKMFKLGILDRHTRGIGLGASNDGFPKYVYSYTLKNSNKY